MCFDENKNVLATRHTGRLIYKTWSYMHGWLDCLIFLRKHSHTKYVHCKNINCPLNGINLNKSGHRKSSNMLHERIVMQTYLWNAMVPQKIHVPTQCVWQRVHFSRQWFQQRQNVRFIINNTPRCHLVSHCGIMRY